MGVGFIKEKSKGAITNLVCFMKLTLHTWVVLREAIAYFALKKLLVFPLLIAFLNY